jgi:ABC-type multidrug transport system permease subunit
MYPVLLYSISWTLAEIPYLCFSTLLFCAICFTMCGVAINSGREFFEFWVIFLEYAACITYFGIFLAMLTPTPQVATIIIPIIVNFWNMTSGFMIPKSKIPNFWIWLYWVNPTQYTINSLIAIAFYCDVELPSCSTCTLDPTTCPSCNCVRVKDEGNVLAWLIMQSAMSLNYNSRYKNMGALFGLNIVFMVGCVLALRYMKYNRR